MAAKVVAVAQQKGGAGKTTIAAQLAVTWTAQRKRVALLDVDPQRSLSFWGAERERGGIKGPPAVLGIQGWRLATEIDRLKSEFDLLVIDTPPHADSDARVAARAAALILVPLQPSPMDLWATAPTLELARREKGRALLVLNRVPARARLVETVTARIAAEGMPLAEARLGNRSAFAASMLEGKGVTESHPRSAAAEEVAALAAEIAGFLKAS